MEYCLVNLETKTLATNRDGAPILTEGAENAYKTAILCQHATRTAWASLPWDADASRWNSPARLPRETAPWLD